MSKTFDLIVERGRRAIADDAILALSPLGYEAPTASEELARRRTDEIIAEWFRLNSIRTDAVSLGVLVRSAYLQGCSDMATAAIEHGIPRLDAMATEDAT